MLKNVLQMIEKMEREIDGKPKISISTAFGGLKFSCQFELSTGITTYQYIVDNIELMDHYQEEYFIIYFIARCNEIFHEKYPNSQDLQRL